MSIDKVIKDIRAVLNCIYTSESSIQRFKNTVQKIPLKMPDLVFFKEIKMSETKALLDYPGNEIAGLFSKNGRIYLDPQCEKYDITHVSNLGTILALDTLGVEPTQNNIVATIEYVENYKNGLMIHSRTNPDFFKQRIESRANSLKKETLKKEREKNFEIFKRQANLYSRKIKKDFEKISEFFKSVKLLGLPLKDHVHAKMILENSIERKIVIYKDGDISLANISNSRVRDDFLKLEALFEDNYRDLISHPGVVKSFQDHIEHFGASELCVTPLEKMPNKRMRQFMIENNPYRLPMDYKIDFGYLSFGDFIVDRNQLSDEGVAIALCFNDYGIQVTPENVQDFQEEMLRRMNVLMAKDVENAELMMSKMRGK